MVASIVGECEVEVWPATGAALSRATARVFTDQQVAPARTTGPPPEECPEPDENLPAGGLRVVVGHLLDRARTNAAFTEAVGKDEPDTSRPTTSTVYTRGVRGATAPLTVAADEGATDRPMAKSEGHDNR